MSKRFFRSRDTYRDNASSGSRTPEQQQRQVDSLVALGLLGKEEQRPRKREIDRARERSANIDQYLRSTRGNPPVAYSPVASASNPARAFSQRSTTSLASSYSHVSKRSIDYKNRVGGMSGMLDAERSRTRRERTFVGSECAVCEEPLEHTLLGERILQFSCGHVSHEECFYEYIKELDTQSCPTCNAPLSLDTSRGGNVLDIEKLSSVVRSAPHHDGRSVSTATPTPWDPHPPIRDSRNGSAMSYNRDSRDTRESSRDSRDQYAPRSRHGRNDSEATDTPSSVGYPETSVSNGARRHDYDVHPMDPGVASHRTSGARNPIPAPNVFIRSEFPTLYRSRQQQTLTCLVTIEVPDNKWRPDPEDLRQGPPPTPVTNRDKFRAPSPEHKQRYYPYEPQEDLDEITENLRHRVENWHGLDFSRFGKLRLYGTIKVGKDKQAWQELECYLFAEMLICVKEKKLPTDRPWEGNPSRKTSRCALKGSILIKKHLKEVTQSSSKSQYGMTQRITESNLQPGHTDNILTLSLSVAELPQFHLLFDNLNQLKLWQQALRDLNAVEASPLRTPDYENSDPEEDDWHRVPNPKRVSSVNSSQYDGVARSATTAITEYTTATRQFQMPASVHVPVDIVVVVPISSSMQGVKISLVRDALKFMVQNLGDRDRMSVVTFGASGGATVPAPMSTKAWNGWPTVLANIRPVGQKNHRADVVAGANAAMDVIMARNFKNPIASILLISDSSTSDAESADFVIPRAEGAKVAIHTFGLGVTHKPDTMIELSTRTKASYTYVKDWMMLRECLAGCLGALQTMSHHNVRLKLRLPEGSPAKFVKTSGALQITKKATGKDVEASLGDLRFGDKRDILVQLVIAPDTGATEQIPQDPWESIVSGLEALGGSLDQENERVVSVEEVPLIQADLTWGDLLRDNTLTHLPQPSLLTITMLPPTPASKKPGYINASPIPPHPSVVQRRMELLTSDMLTRALTLVSRGQHDRAQTLLTETRSILKGLGKGGLPPIPPPPSGKPPHPNRDRDPMTPSTTANSSPTTSEHNGPDRRQRTPSPTSAISNGSNGNGFAHGNGNNGNGPANALPISRSRSNDTLTAPQPYPPSTPHPIDPTTVAALDSELEAALEWINHPAVFGRDSRKAVLQAISVISSQRGYTFRSSMEALWAERIEGVRRLGKRSREWRDEGGGGGLGVGGEIVEEN